MRRDYDVNTSS